MIRAAQLLLIVAAAALWAASRLDWASVRSFDGLGQPRTATLNGAEWSNALVPLAVLMLVVAIAGLAVRGWLLRLMAALVAAGAGLLGYLGISLMVLPDVGPRTAALSGTPIVHLVGSQRHLLGASITVAAAVCALLAAALLLRAGSSAREVTKYRPGAAVDDDGTTERAMWDALDAGHDPTAADGQDPDPAGTEGR